MYHFTKLICKGILRHVFICLFYSPPPPLHTLYVHLLIHTGKGGGRGRVDQKEDGGATVHKAGSKIPT